jgi:hypothetical protein
MLPSAGEFVSVKVSGLEIMAAIETELHRAFAAGAVTVSAVAAAEPITDVVIYFPVINHGSRPIIHFAGFLQIIVG